MSREEEQYSRRPGYCFRQLLRPGMTSGNIVVVPEPEALSPEPFGLLLNNAGIPVRVANEEVSAGALVQIGRHAHRHNIARVSIITKMLTSPETGMGEARG